MEMTVITVEMMMLESNGDGIDDMFNADNGGEMLIVMVS